jgi:hypothetical protein
VPLNDHDCDGQLVLQSVLMHSCAALTVPATSRAVEGAEVPIPSRLFALSQKKFEASNAVAPLPIWNGTAPVIPPAMLALAVALSMMPSLFASTLTRLVEDFTIWLSGCHASFGSNAKDELDKIRTEIIKTDANLMNSIYAKLYKKILYSDRA